MQEWHAGANAGTRTIAAIVVQQTGRIVATAGAGVRIGKEWSWTEAGTGYAID